MDMRLFDKSPQVASLLVRLYDSQRLHDLVKDTSPLARAEVTSAVAELLEADVVLTGREQELLADALIALMRQAHHDLRQALAERLSVIDNVPLRLVLHLANDEIDIASPVLRSSPVLSDLDLIYIIKSKGAEYWQAIAAREQLSDHVVNILADTRNVPTALVLTQNERLKLTQHAIVVLSDMAKASGDLARPLLMRPEVPVEIARKLYGHVGQDLREYIQSYFGILRGDARVAVDDITVEFSDSHEDFVPNDRVMQAARQYAAKGKLTLQSLIQVLKRGQMTTFVAMFSVYTGVPPKEMESHLRQSSGKALAVICRAHGIQKNDCALIYLLTNRMRSDERIINQNSMLQLMDYFDRVRPEVAQRVIKTLPVN